jgi:hypothetical protein
MSDEPDTLPTRAELARDRLLHVMRDDAEEVWASWLVDQEFYLWEAACLGRFPHAVGEAGARSASASGWAIWARWRVAGGRGRMPSDARGTRRFFCRWMNFIRSMRPGSANRKRTKRLTAQGTERTTF